MNSKSLELNKEQINKQNSILNSELKRSFVENVPSEQMVSIISISIIVSIVSLIFGLILLLASNDKIVGWMFIGCSILLIIVNITKIPIYIRYFLKNKEVHNKVDEYNKFRKRINEPTISYNSLRNEWTRQKLLKEFRFRI